MNTPRILSIQPQENKKLLVKFANGVGKLYDCTPLLSRDMFWSLKNDAFFKSVRVDAGGYGMSWNDEIDLSEDEIWINGVESVIAKANIGENKTVNGVNIAEHNR